MTEYKGKTDCYEIHVHEFFFDITVSRNSSSILHLLCILLDNKSHSILLFRELFRAKLFVTNSTSLHINTQQTLDNIID